MRAVKAPPIKTQGIKTKLVAFIADSVQWEGDGRWVEPFMGSAVVALNMLPKRALLADTNPHLVRVYRDIQQGTVDHRLIREFLEFEGSLLRSRGSEHYYEVRERFNDEPNSFDFLFLNRSCFNGVMRFNSKGRFNVPFCKKENRFAPAYVTKIANQVRWASEIIADADFEFRTQDWSTTLGEVRHEDFVYLDPSYAGRSTDYFNTWSDDDAERLAERALALRCGFALSIWLENKYRKNSWVAEHFSEYPVRTLAHFYHVGSSEALRNEMTEALVIQKGFDAVPRAEGQRALQLDLEFT